MTPLAEQAAAYFRNQPEYQRLFEELTAKYRSLGRLAGRVRLETLNMAEAEALSGLFQDDWRAGEDAVLPVGRFGQALARTRFAGVEPLALLQAYHGGELLTRKEARERERERRARFFQTRRERWPHPRCQRFLAVIESSRQIGGRARKMQRADPESFAAALDRTMTALAQLPEAYERLPFFAARVCGDPHALDPGAPAGRLFLDALGLLRSESGQAPPADDDTSQVEVVAELLYHFKLVRDDILNFVACAGILAWRDHDDPLPLWRAACDDRAALNMPLRELLRTTRLAPAHFADRDETGQVFVVENAGVFSALLEKCPAAPLVCPHGQFKLAAWVMLDRLVAGGATLRYSGDFDPEGLRMAQTLLTRYGDRAQAWRMSPEDYRAAGAAVPLPNPRLAKLNAIDSPALIPAAEAIRETALAAYQEALLDRLAADIAESLSPEPHAEGAEQ